MEIGMLWYDNDAKRTLPEKVQRAVDFYKAKYKRAATVAFVHPAMLPDGKPGMVAGVMLRGNRTIIKHHFWLGIEDSVPA